MAKSKSTVRRPDQLHRSAIRASHKGDPAWEARWAWERIKDRVIYKPGGRNKCYAGIQLRMTRDEYLAWAVPAYTEWLAANPGKVASIDRIRSEGHYEIGNLQILEHVENARRSSHLKNLKAPGGMAWCSGHRAYLPKGEFYAHTRRHGVSSECQQCTKQRTQRDYRRRPKMGRTGGKPIQFGGRCLTVTEWAAATGIPRNVLFIRLYNGWSVERALTEPVRSRSKRTTRLSSF
jgi:hypothetical protein